MGCIPGRTNVGFWNSALGIWDIELMMTACMPPMPSKAFKAIRKHPHLPMSRNHAHSRTIDLRKI